MRRLAMKNIYMLLAAMLLMVITSCGGGGGGSDPIPAPSSSAKAITAFSLGGVDGTINETGKTIAVSMPFGTDVTAMVATFTTTGASVKVGSTVQISGTTANNFTSPVVYTVTAADATTQDYTVTVTVAASSAKAITAFSIGGVIGTINETGKTIAVTMPSGTSVTALVATFTTTGANVKVGSTVQVSGTTAHNFTAPVVYTVSAVDATTQDYTVTVTVALSSAKAITAFSLAGVAGTINETGKTIAVTMPSGTSVTALVATFTTTGASVKVGSTVQISGTTANNFTSPVIYTVTAADATTQGYTITVTVPRGPWTQKTDFGGTARAGAVGFSIGSKGYIATGEEADGLFKKDFWEYDPAANTWTQRADFGGTARAGAVGFSIGTKGYIGTGSEGPGYYTYTKTFWEYDPAANTWTQRADFGGAARAFAVGFSIGTKGYIGTGMGTDGGLGTRKDFWEYDPAVNTWTQKTDFGGAARDQAVGFSIGSKGYIGTGYGNSSNRFDDFWEYDPAANTWTKKATVESLLRYQAVGFSIGSKGYIVTGVSGIYNEDFWEYDPAANTWTQRADFGGTGRQHAVGFSIGSKGYIGTGWDPGPGYTKDFWEYDPGL